MKTSIVLLLLSLSPVALAKLPPAGQGRPQKICRPINDATGL
jgi:hypothetical protein